MKRKTEQKRLAIQLLVIYGIYNICWGPFAAVELFLDSAGNYPSWLYSILLVLLCVNSAVNVFVYMHYNRAFRFVCLKGLKVKPASATSSSDNYRLSHISGRHTTTNVSTV